MKILLICISDRWGGLEKTVVRDAVALRDKGHDIAILGSLKGNIYNHTRLNNLTFFSIKSKPNYFNLEIYIKLKKILNDICFDIVHIHEFKSIFPVMMALRTFKGGVFATRHIHVEHVKKDFFHKWYLSRINMMFGISDFSRQNIIDTYPINAQNVETLYLGIDLVRLRRTSDKSYLFRSKNNINNNSSVVGVIGRIDPMKGQKEFIESIPAILEIRRNIYFVIIGQPTSETEEAYLESLKTRCYELGIMDQVIFAGYFEDVSIPLSAMDILVMPSYFEAFGLVAIEAMACEVPVIATDKGSVSEFISSHKYGLKIKPKDSKAISDAVIKLMSDRVLYDLIKLNAFDYVQSHFDERNYFNVLESKYNSYIGNK